MRKARIDLQADIRFTAVTSGAEQDCLKYFGTLDQLRDPRADACMALATIKYPAGPDGYLIYVKPNMYNGLPVDLLNYKRDNPAFPQESTTDQFFSESQWESYFVLGRSLGKVLDPGFLQGLGHGGERNFCQVAPDAAPGPAHKTAAATLFEYISPRFGSLAKSGLSLTAAAALATGAWQGWEHFSEARAGKARALASDVGALSGMHERVLSGDLANLPELTAKLASIAATYCADDASEIRNVRQAAMIFSDIRARCVAALSSANVPSRSTPSCDVLLSEQIRSCLGGAEGKPREATYWGIQYANSSWAREVLFHLPRFDISSLPFAPTYVVQQAAGALPAPTASTAAVASANGPTPSGVLPSAARAASAAAAAVASAAAQEKAAAALAKAAAPAPAPVQVPAPAPAPAPAVVAVAPKQVPASAPMAAGLAACSGKTVYLQIYNSDQRASATELAQRLRQAKATVPGIEDVVATAQRDMRKAPVPARTPTVIFHTDAESDCARQLLNDAALAGGSEPPRARRLGGGLIATPGVVEIWLPPGKAR